MPRGSARSRDGPRPLTTTSKWKSAVVVPLEGTTFSGIEGGRGGAPGTPFTFDKLSLIGQIGNSAGVFRMLTAKSVKEVRPGVYVYNMGQNMVGVPRITIASGRAGGKITLRYSEMLYPDSRRVREERRHDHDRELSCRAQPGRLHDEGGSAGLPAPLHVARLPVHRNHRASTSRSRSRPFRASAISSVRELSADYKTSNEKVNRLWSNLVWSNVDNFLTIPTDCPQRNERMGWSGDINVFSRTATYRIECRSVPDPAYVRHARRAGPVGQVHRRRAGRRRLRRRPLGKRRDRGPVGSLSAIQRCRAAGAPLSGDGRLYRLPRNHHRSEDRA